MAGQVNRTSTSRRHFLRQSGFAALTVLVAGYGVPARATTPNQAEPALMPPQVSSAGQSLLAMPDVPIEVKIGQMLLVGFRGGELEPESVIVKNVRDQHVGGVVLFTGNIKSPEQVRALTAGLKALAALPLLISVDQEGGKISRLNDRRGFPPSPSANLLGALNNLEETRSQSRNMAQTLIDAGINLNLAPVVDVAVNSDNPVIARLGRSFSSNPATVAAHAAAFIDGEHDKGIRCTLKHFPGHGSSEGDTHLGLVDVTNTWSDSELIPYRTLIGQGKVDAIMTAHIFNANLDASLPATLSPAVVDGLLRQQLGYAGVVITDDMQMRAIADLYRLDKAFELAILAGVDILAVGSNVTPDRTVADVFIATVRGMLAAGTISEERIDNSFRRIMQLKGLAG